MIDFGTMATHIVNSNTSPASLASLYCDDRNLDFENVAAAFADWRDAYLNALVNEAQNQIDQLCPMGDDDAFAESFEGFADKHGLNEDERYVFCYMVHSFDMMLEIGGDIE